MKKISVIFCLATVFVFASCSNQTAETNEPVEITADSTPQATSPVTGTPSGTLKKDHVEVEGKDTARTEISIGQQGGSIKTKKGTGVSVDKNGVEVGSKDIKIDIKKDTNQ